MRDADGAVGGGAGGRDRERVRVSYLARGLSWAPAYRVTLEDPTHLTIEQQATVKNEMGDLADAEVTLISGYPSVQFGHVVSPMWVAGTSWAQFFAELAARPA